VAKVKAAPAEELSALVGPAKAKKIRAFFEK
jgi:excinuclease ABC subunit C